MHHKFHGSWFDNNSYTKFIFHKFIWNKHGCYSFTCIVLILMPCALFKHKCYTPIHVVHTRKLCTGLPYLNDTNSWNNKFHTNLKQTHETCKFVMCLFFSSNFFFSIFWWMDIEHQSFFFFFDNFVMQP